MPSVNQQSLREEFDTLKGEFEKLSSEGKITRESRALFQGMLMLLELVLAVFMEKTTKKNGNNSSLPSSQTDKDETSTGQPGSNSKGPNQNKEPIANSRTIETVEVAEVHCCATCGEDLHQVSPCAQERRTRIDIFFEKVVNHVDAEIKECPVCHAQTKGQFPSYMAGPLQYGAGIKAFVLNLLIAQMISLSRIQKSIQTLIGLAISEATILKYVTQLYLALENWEQSAIDQLLKSLTINADETSIRVDKKNYWIHVYSSGDISLKCLHRRRGCEAIDDIGIIPRYGGVVIHDCWASYLSYNHCQHGLCGSHLLRELTFIVESNQYLWAADMKALLRETCIKVSKRKTNKLILPKFLPLNQRYHRILSKV